MAKIVFTKIDPNQFKKPEKDILYGTGITKKLVERDVKAANKAEMESLEAAAKGDESEIALKQLEDAAKDTAHILDLKKSRDFELDESQKLAVQGAREHAHLCIIGAAGCGKTTIEREIIDATIADLPEIEVSKTNMKRDKDDPDGQLKVYSFAVCAFTGRAVQQSKRALPKRYQQNCMTIHRMLGYAPVMEPRPDPDNPGQYKEVRVFRPTYHALNKLPYDLIIVEESSMAPVRLMNEVFAAAKEGCRFMYVGDINQLPPVQDISILPFAMLKYPTYELTKIHRQAADNPIIANAHKILNGLYPVPDPKHFVMKNISDGSLTASKEILGWTKALHGKGLFDPMRDALIVQANVRELGQVYLNSDLMNYFNPPKTDANGVVLNRRVPIKASRGTALLAVGDKVMATANDNDLGITNGMIGVVVEISRNGMFRDKHISVSDGDAVSTDAINLGDDDFELEAEIDDADTEEQKELSKEDKEREKDENQRQASHITTIHFSSTDDVIEVKLQTVGQYNSIQHAYAITAHKSQGGEYPHVMICIHTVFSRMLTREWLYTAVTRAQERVFMFYNNNALAKALKNQAIKGANTKEKAESFLRFMGDDTKVKPNLPDARPINRG